MTDKFYALKEGMPTGPDVAALQKAFPNIQVGDVIDYAAVSAVIAAPWNTVRFRVVTAVWRKRLLEAGVVLDCVSGEAFRALTADQISAKTYGTLESIGRKAHKQRIHLSTIRPEDDAQKHVIMHQMQLMLATERDAKRNRMNLIPGTEIREPVRIAPPGGAA